MKEFIGIARNIYQSIDEVSGAACPNVELIITVSEPKPMIENGEIISKRELSDIRFVCSLDALKMLAVTSMEIIQSMERLGMVKKEKAESASD